MIKTIMEIQDILGKSGLGWTITYVPENDSYIIDVRNKD